MFNDILISLTQYYKPNMWQYLFLCLQIIVNNYYVLVPTIVSYSTVLEYKCTWMYTEGEDGEYP